MEKFDYKLDQVEVYYVLSAISDKLMSCEAADELTYVLLVRKFVAPLADKLSLVEKKPESVVSAA